QLCARATAAKTDLFKILQMACVNPVNHYKLNVGQLRVGDAADFIVLKDLTKFDVLQTFINGECVAENGKTKIIISSSIQIINHFHCDRISPEILAYPVSSAAYPYPIIEAFDGQLITGKIEDQPLVDRKSV